MSAADRTYVEVWRAEGRAVHGSAGAVEAALARLVEKGRAAWPELPLEGALVVRHLARVVAEPSSADDLEALSAEGLTLAAACTERVPGALQAFEASQAGPLLRVLARLEGGRDVADDALQRLRLQLFPPAGSAPTLFLAYSGRGAMTVWLKVVAVRVAQRLRRDAGRVEHDGDEGLGALPSPDADPELRFLKLQHRRHFKAAFATALAGLEPRERSVLRLSLVEGLSIDDIGKVYDVHRATAARWLSAARDALVLATRSALRERLKLASAELDEVMGAMQSHLSLSLSVGLKSLG